MRNIGTGKELVLFSDSLLCVERGAEPENEARKEPGNEARKQPGGCILVHYKSSVCIQR